jgi:hypothetical protein
MICTQIIRNRLLNHIQQLLLFVPAHLSTAKAFKEMQVPSFFKILLLRKLVTGKSFTPMQAINFTKYTERKSNPITGLDRP